MKVLTKENGLCSDQEGVAPKKLSSGRRDCSYGGKKLKAE